MRWRNLLFGANDRSLVSRLAAVVVVPVALGLGYLAGVLGTSSFAPWSGPTPPLAATATAVALSGAFGYARGGLVIALAGSCLAFLSTAVERVFFEYVGFTLPERVAFLLDLDFLIVSWGCLFGCVGYACGVLLRRLRFVRRVRLVR
jgi:hypothetical protein